MSILETDIRSRDALLWDTKIRQARRDRTPLPKWEDISPYGDYTKIIRFTATDLDTIRREVVICRTNDDGEIVAGTEQPMEEPDFLVKQEITEAGIKVGSSVLIWQETFVPYKKSA